MTREEYERDGNPLNGFGRRRDTAFHWTANHIAEMRCFCHLSAAGIRSYLLHLPETRWGHSTVRKDGAAKQWQEVCRTAIKCPTCSHSHYSSVGRWVVAAPDAATSVGRKAFYGRLAFDVGRAARIIAWRLGVSCVICGAFCGRRLRLAYDRSSVLGDHWADVLCPDCRKTERKHIKEWGRRHGYGERVPKEWLLLKAVERQRSKPRAAPAKQLPK